MSEPAANTSRKWRPSLSLVVFVVLTSVLALPLFSIYFLKVYQNQLIQQAEAELIAQSAVLAATFRREVETGVPPGVALGAKVAPAARKTIRGAVSADLARTRTGQRERAAAATGGAPAVGAGRSRLRSARRAHGAGSGRHPEGDAGRLPAARSQRRRDRRPRGSRAVAGASGGSARGAAGTLQGRAARAHLQERTALALFDEPGHRDACLHRDAGDRRATRSPASSMPRARRATSSSICTSSAARSFSRCCP